MTVKILWGTRVGDPNWMEEVLTENEERFEDAKKWALANGFDRFRVAELDLSTPPDFTKTLNI